MVNPMLGFNPTFRQIVNNLDFLISEAPDPAIYLADMECVADDCETSVYWVEQACDWLERFGPFPVDENGLPVMYQPAAGVTTTTTGAREG